MQLPSAAPDDPALQLQEDKAELPAGELEFIGHCEHAKSDVAPKTVENLLASHSIQVSDAAEEYVPLRQFVHVYAPGSSENFPARQSLQLGDPSLPPYFPVGQSRHMVSEEAPTPAPYVPTRQVVHVTEPVTSLNFPASHCVQGPPSGPVDPVLQVQNTAPVGA